MLNKLISSILIFTILFSDFSIIFADETIENPEIQQENTNSWATDSQTQPIIENTIPNIIISFQTPSYLTDKDLIQDTYHCDTSKDECKVNFDLRDTFWWYVPAKFACLNTFSFNTWEETECNPNQITFPIWNHTIIFKIYEEDNPSNFKEKSIVIVNEIPQNQSETNTWATAGTGSSIEEPVPSNSWSIDSGTWELIESWSINTETNSGWLEETSSWNTETNSGWKLEIPNVDIEIQSWLELVNWNYKCKNTDCKINLNLENLFTWTYDINNYSCSWDFGSGTFTTVDTDKKCNPGYVNYWTWNFEIKTTIYEKNNLSNFKTWSLEFSNWELFESWNFESWSWNIDKIDNSNTSSWSENNTESWWLQTQNFLEIPNVDIEIQSWLELVNWIYKCKNIDCKVNLNLEKIFTWIYDIKNYSFLWDFSWWTHNTDINSCNPWYVSYGTWIFEIIATISEKNNLNNFKTWSLNFENLINNIKTVSSQWWSNVSSISNQKVKDIIMQSWANKIRENTYECNEEKCKINMQYENSSNETCLWNFWWWIYKENYTTTCNPSYIYYFSWEYKIKLNLYKSWIFSEEKNITLTNNFLDNAKISNLWPKAKITLQWTIWKNKELDWNKLICKNTKECSINFDWSESSDPNLEELIYYWDFWNWEFEEKVNPKTIKYHPWKYKVKLKVTDRFWEFSEDYFYIEVYEKEQEVLKINENIIKYIKIIEALPNPVWSEENERIKIKNDSINFVNIKWLEIDDKIWEWSKSYIIKDDFYLLPYQEKKLYKSETKLNLNNSFDEVNLIYNDTIIDSLIWNYEVPEWFIIKKDIKEKAKVLKVIDWDTILIQFENGTKEKLRLIWVDTPETKHPKKEVEKWWIEAYNFTFDTLNWKEIILELDYLNYRDKYDRLLGYVWVDDINFNKLLIEKWYARAYLYFPFRYYKEFENAEKDAKKQKLGIWSSEEMKDEIKELEKIEKVIELENMKFDQWFNYSNLISKITNFFDIKTLVMDFKKVFSFNYDKKSIQKEALIEFDNLILELFPESTKTKKISKVKQEKIITYRTSKLKSGLKITWNTFPWSLVILDFDDIKLETVSDELWKYTFLISDNLKVWEYKLDFVVLNWDTTYNFQAPKMLSLNKDYIFWVQDYKVKQANKKVKKKKAKKAKKKKLVAKKSTLKKMKYDIKDIKKDEDKSPSNKNIILIFLLSILVSIMWFFVIRKID